jgi:hypothetical protein
MAMDVTGERFRPVIDHLHRLPGVKGEEAQMDVEVDVLPRPECTTDAGGVGADLLRA